MVLGIVGYPLVKKPLSKFANYEVRLLTFASCVVPAMYGSGYYAKYKCEEKLKNQFAEARRKELEEQKQPELKRQ